MSFSIRINSKCDDQFLATIVYFAICSEISNFWFSIKANKTENVDKNKTQNVDKN